MSSRREYILSHWTCTDFANRILGWPVHQSGDRCLSIHPGIHRHKNLVVYDDYFIDHKVDPVWHEKLSGSVIDLCAYTMFNGDIGAAMDYLAGDFYKVDKTFYRERKKKIQQNVEFWHKKLRPHDIEYLHSRRINDDTIRRLKLGYTCYDDPETKRTETRLVIPYFKNGEIVYYISRDRSITQCNAKYKKALTCAKDKNGKVIPGTEEQIVNIPWGLHTIYQYDKANQLTFNFEDIEQGKISIDKSEWLIIAEGVFDAMSFEQEKFCVLSPMGGYFNALEMKQIIQIAKLFKNVLVIFDNDGYGSDFQKNMAKELFSHRINFFCGTVPKEFNGQQCKDVSDYYVAGGDLADLVREASLNGRGIDTLVSMSDSPSEIRELLQKYARYAEKADVIELLEKLKSKAITSASWLQAVKESALGCPAESVVVKELTDKHKIKYLERSGFFEYRHGLWEAITDNTVKRYADDILGRFSTHSRMNSIMLFARARTSVIEEMNRQPVVNFPNGVLLLDDECRFVPHDECYMSSIQMKYRYDPQAKCDLWLGFVDAVMRGDKKKIMLLQEIGGYILWPNNGLEKCFFLMGDGGNGKGVYMDTLRQVFHPENCSSLELSQLAGEFNPMLLRYSLVNLCSENRVNLKGTEARIKAITSGDYITAAHKGVDAESFQTRCKLITSCNDFFNSNDITHAFLRRLIFVNFDNNYVQQKKADVSLRQKLLAELPGIMNWCIEGYKRLLSRKGNPEGQFTETDESRAKTKEFMESVNPIVSFFADELEDRSGESIDSREIYNLYKGWAIDNGHKPMSKNACTYRIKQVFRARRPDVVFNKYGHTDIFIYP